MRLSLILSLIAVPAVAEVTFAPVQVPEHVYTGGWEHFVGGGVAVFDCDNDGLPELYAAGGSSPAQLLRNRSTAQGLAFDADTPPALAVQGVTGAYPLHINGDAHLDLVVLRVGQNLLFEGGEECRFEPMQGLGWQSADRWTTAFSATWETGRTLPTLAFGNYVDRSDPDGPFRACDVTVLYRPNGGQYGAADLLQPGYCALSMLFSDWGRWGRADLRISNDRHYYVDAGEEQMWAMTEPPRLYDAQDGWQSHKLWGMGIASRDLSGDGVPEVMLSSMGDQRLQRLDTGTEGPQFRDMGYDTGTTAHRPYVGGDGRPSTGWHIAFGDVQNDGRDDIFIAKGNVEMMADAAMDDPNNLLLQGADGHFVEHGAQAGVASLHRGRGAALADLDGDGRLDLVVVNRRAPLEVYHNLSQPVGHWLAITLHQQGGNPRAVGAWIDLRVDDRTLTREVTVGGGHAGGSAGPEHFGLGAATGAEVRVTWPDGTVGAWQRLDANHHVTLSR